MGAELRIPTSAYNMNTSLCVQFKKIHVNYYLLATLL